MDCARSTFRYVPTFFPKWMLSVSKLFPRLKVPPLSFLNDILVNHEIIDDADPHSGDSLGT